MDYKSLPDGVRHRLDVADRLEWMCRPLSGYLIKVFLDAFELGRVWGSIMLERIINPMPGIIMPMVLACAQTSLTNTALNLLWNLLICFGG